MEAYPVPKTRVRTEMRVSNSRFITTIDRAPTMQAAQDLLREMRTEMPDASHHVYAFRVGYGASINERLSDDGEPSGTSGPPAMAVVRGQDIGDVALVITRYFGGTKLGTGGLVSAYTEAAKAGFAALETELKVDWVTLHGSIPYALLESIRKQIHEHDGLIEQERFDAAVHLQLRVPQPRVAALLATIRDRSAGQVTLTIGSP